MYIINRNRHRKQVFWLIFFLRTKSVSLSRSPCSSYSCQLLNHPTDFHESWLETCNTWGHFNGSLLRRILQQLRKMTVWVYCNSLPSVCPYGTIRIPLDEFSWMFILETCTEICPHNRTKTTDTA